MAVSDNTPSVPSLATGFLPVSATAELLGVSADSVRAWCDDGTLRTYRNNLRGWRRIDASSISEFIQRNSISSNGKDSKIENEIDEYGIKTIIKYHRVSSVSQSRKSKISNESSLEKQIKLVEDYYQEHYKGIYAEAFSEVGSSLNFARPKLLTILKNILDKKYARGSILLALEKNRLCRIGREFIEFLCSTFGIEIQYTNQTIEPIDEEKEVAEDIITFLTVHCNRASAKRSRLSTVKKLNESTIQKGLSLLKAGISTNQAVKILNDSGETTADGEPITEHLFNTRILTAFNTGNEAPSNLVELFISSELIKADSATRLPFSIVFEAYRRFASIRHIPLLSQTQFGFILGKRGIKKITNRCPQTNKRTVCLKGYILRINKDAHFEIKKVGGQPKAKNCDS